VVARPGWHRQLWRLGHGGWSGQLATQKCRKPSAFNAVMDLAMRPISLFDGSQLAAVEQARRGIALSCSEQHKLSVKKPKGDRSGKRPIHRPDEPGNANALCANATHAIGAHDVDFIADVLYAGQVAYGFL
jgi:hypothetical protein